MALRINTMFKNIPINQAYVTVELPQISLDKSTVEFGVWYRTERGQEQFHAESLSAPYTLSADDPFKQAYEYLKTLPEFIGCTDC